MQRVLNANGYRCVIGANAMAPLGRDRFVASALYLCRSGGATDFKANAGVGKRYGFDEKEALDELDEAFKAWAEQQP